MCAFLKGLTSKSANGRGSAVNPYIRITIVFFIPVNILYTTPVRLVRADARRWEHDNSCRILLFFSFALSKSVREK